MFVVRSVNRARNEATAAASAQGLPRSMPATVLLGAQMANNRIHLLPPRNEHGQDTERTGISRELDQ
jgi:hypothetical protein